MSRLFVVLFVLILPSCAWTDLASRSSETILVHECEGGARQLDGYWHICGNYWEITSVFLGKEHGEVTGEAVDSYSVFVTWTNYPGSCVTDVWLRDHNYKTKDIQGFYWSDGFTHNICAPALTNQKAISIFDHEAKHITDKHFHGEM